MTDIQNHRFPGIFNVKDNDRESLSTKTLVPHQSVYGEKIMKKDGEEYRLWATRRSKLAAAIKKGLREMLIQPGSRVLYLGAASGTTVSHVSDIVGENGVVFAVEFSVQVARKLIRLAETRPNIVPIIGDARHPARYAPLIGSTIDIIYQDVAQPNQARILLENLSTFCSMGGYGMIAIKARSIDSTSGTDEVYNKEISELAAGGTEIIDNVNLDPLEKDHRFIVVRLAEAPM
ncbi:MAG: fibrillarin-like rRNA/tRNA 2'-O-methyltransferase [Candidatus Thorarchaeota archaeon]